MLPPFPRYAPAVRAAITASLSASMAFSAYGQVGGETTTEQPSAQRLERIEVSARPQTTTELRRQSMAAKQIYD